MISGATIAAHKAHHSVWDLKNSAGAPVPDGQYTIYIEVTESENVPGPWTSIPFEINGTPQVIAGPDDPYYSNVTVTLQ